MWSRKELKGTSKIRFQANYWKCILVALLLAVIVGGGANGAGSGWHSDSSDYEDYSSNMASTIVMTNSGSLDLSSVEAFFSNPINTAILFSIVIVGVIIVFLVICIVVIPLQVFVFNPLEIGGRRFFSKNLNEDASVKEICYSFDNNYKNSVKIMFFRDLYIFLWSLLLIIPGIVKSYEYRMIPYILGDHPEMDKESVFELSRKMMDGNKWNAFVLDLSFIGWHILSACTLGILGIFYVNPYYRQTEAALYDALKNQALPVEL